MALSIADYAAKMQLNQAPSIGSRCMVGLVIIRTGVVIMFVRKLSQRPVGFTLGLLIMLPFYGQLRQTLGTDAYLEQEKRGLAYMQERNFKTLTWFKRRDTKGKTNSSAFDAYSAMTVVEYLLTLDPPIDRQAAIELAEAIMLRVEDRSACHRWHDVQRRLYSHSGPSANLRVRLSFIIAACRKP